MPIFNRLRYKLTTGYNEQQFSSWVAINLSKEYSFVIETFKNETITIDSVVISFYAEVYYIEFVLDCEVVESFDIKKGFLKLLMPTLYRILEKNKLK